MVGKRYLYRLKKLKKLWTLIFDIPLYTLNYFLEYPFIPPTFHLNWAVTYLCNSKCKHCNIWRFYKENPEKLKEELKLEECLRVIRNLPKNTKIVSLTGGEPTLKNGIEEIIKNLLNKYNLSHVNITTNCLSPKKIREILENLPSKSNVRLHFHISIDGPEEIHDKIRVKGNYKKCLEVINLIKNCELDYVDVFIGYTLSKITYKYFDKFIEEINFPLEKISCSLFEISEYFGVKENNKLTGKDLKELIKKYDNLKDWFYYGATKYLDNRSYKPFHCMAGISHIVLDPWGNLRPCLYNWTEKWIIGNIKNYNYDIIKTIRKNLDNWRRIIKEVKEFKCPNCWSLCETQHSVFTNMINLIKLLLKLY